MLFNAKDEKIIHDYSQQRCILNKNSSGEPVDRALLVLETLVGVPFLGGNRYLDYGDELNANKDKIIIHDYSQQSRILNQTSSDEPFIWASIIGALHNWVSLVGVHTSC